MGVPSKAYICVQGWGGGHSNSVDYIDNQNVKKHILSNKGLA